jgi:beta-mannosidase
VDPADVPPPPDSTHQSDYFSVNWCASSKYRTKLMFGREFSPDNPEELCKAVNFYVADAHKAGIEIFRLQRFRRTGMIWWSLLDMWPMAFNYSVVDSNFCKKFPFEAIRLSQQPVILAGKDPEPGELPELHVVNDTAYRQNGTWRATDPDGNEIASGTFEAEPNGKAKIGTLPLAVSHYCFLEWNCGTFSGKNYYVNPGEPYDFDVCCRMMEQVRNLR